MPCCSFFSALLRRGLSVFPLCRPGILKLGLPFLRNDSSDWRRGVGALAVLNISASVFRRTRFTLRGVGVSLTHAFLVVLILAGALQYFLRTEGILVLDAGEVSHEILAGGGNGRKNIPLGFSVKLKKFDARTWTGSDIPQQLFKRGLLYARRGKHGNGYSHECSGLFWRLDFLPEQLRQWGPHECNHSRT